jgi:hypothetical protein
MLTKLCVLWVRRYSSRDRWGESLKLTSSIIYGAMYIFHQTQIQYDIYVSKRFWTRRLYHVSRILLWYSTTANSCLLRVWKPINNVHVCWNKSPWPRDYEQMFVENVTNNHRLSPRVGDGSSAWPISVDGGTPWLPRLTRQSSCQNSDMIFGDVQWLLLTGEI